MYYSWTPVENFPVFEPYRDLDPPYDFWLFFFYKDSSLFLELTDVLEGALGRG
jgi:hypothetical protein